MNKRRKRQEWEQKPGESNPSYVAFVIYYSLGPRRKRIINRGNGSLMWLGLMAGLVGLPDDTPLPDVCEIISGALKRMLRQEIPENADKSIGFPFIKKFLDALHEDEELHSAAVTILSSLEKFERGEELPPLSYLARRNMMRDVEVFLREE